MKKGLFITVLVVLIAAFGISAFYLGNYFLEGKRQADRYEELAALVDNAKNEAAQASTAPTKEADKTADNTSSAGTSAPAANVMLPGLDALYEQNKDLVGWLKIEGTKVDYPVMQTPTDNPNYYLYRNFDKSDSDRGSIYAREECSILRPSDNITMYGHNMKDGSMFAGLNAYTDKAAWEKNSLIFFDTLYEYHVYKIFAVFKTTANLGEGFTYQKFEDAGSEEEFNNFVSTCKSMSFYDTGITPVYGDKMICLSTCEYTLDNGRLVVAAVRIS